MHVVSRGSGPAILFLHGIPTSCLLWSGIVDRMCFDFTCIAVDFPGLGRTGEARGEFGDLRALAASLEAVRIRCGVEKWCVVGHDAGCAIAIHYAQQFPDRMERLALMSPSIFPDLRPFFLFEVLRRRMIGELMAPFISFVFWSFAMRAALEWNGDFKSAIADFRAPFRGFRGAWRLMALLRWGDPSEVLALAPTILPLLTQPALIFHGAKDPAIPESFAHRAAALIPGAKVCIVDAGHFFPMTRAAAVTAELSAFFHAYDSSVVPALAAVAGANAAR